MKKPVGNSRVRTRSPSWQVIYMDLMTIIMVFFVIIWSLSQGKDEGVSATIGDVTTRLINLPGDVLFPAGKTKLSSEGKGILGKLFKDDTGKGILSFANDGLTKRMIVFHGHTDSDGKKSKNLRLGYERAMSAYNEIKAYSPTLSDHVVICTHADNSPSVDLPQLTGKLSAGQKKLLRQAKAKNRRISIEDRSVNLFEDEE